MMPMTIILRSRTTTSHGAALSLLLTIPAMFGPFALTNEAVAQRTLPQQATPSVPPPLQGDTIEALLPSAEQARIRALVEQVSGRSFAVAPPVGIVEPKAMRLAIERALRAMQPKGRFEASQLDQLALRQVTLYDPDTKSIFIGAGGLASVGESERPPVLRTMFAHALMQAIIDQEISIVAFVASDGPEVSMTRRMLSEGFTVTARDRVAQKLGIDPYFAGYRAHLPGIIDPASGPSLERSVYGTGRLVIEGVWNSEGTEAVWRYLATKPESVREISKVIPRSKMIRLLQVALDRSFASTSWQRARAPAAPALALSAIRGIAPAERPGLIERCVTTETLGFSGSKGEAVLITSVRMIDDKSAADLAAALGRMPAALLAEFQVRGIRLELKSATRDVGSVTFSTASLSPTDDSSANPTVLLSGRVGSEVVSITISNATLPPETLARALESIAANLGAAPESEPEDPEPPAASPLPR
jgi:hypothetical protein